MQWQEEPTLPDEHGMNEFLLSQAPARLDSTVVAQRQPEASTQPTQTSRPAIRLQAQYSRPYIAHASIGPSCAVADVQDGFARVWAGTQNPYPLRLDLSILLGFPEQNIEVLRFEAAGCYGRNGHEDAAAEAALLSKAIGQPVRVQWMRHDMTAWGAKGPACVYDLAGAIDANGNVTGIDGNKLTIQFDKAGEKRVVDSFVERI